MVDAFGPRCDALEAECDALQAECDAFAVDDAGTGAPFVMFPSTSENAQLHALASLNPAAFTDITSTLAANGHEDARAKLRALGAAPALLDRSSPAVERAVEQEALTAEVIANRAAPWIIIGPLWSILRCYEGTPHTLVSLNLTAPPEVDTRKHVSALAAGSSWGSEEGALMALDKRGDGSEHVHGIALVGDPGEVTTYWTKATGAAPRFCKLTPITGWEGHVSGAPDGSLLPNVAKVITYAFKPWPKEHGVRRLQDDVLAAGVLAPLWANALPQICDVAASNVRRPPTDCARVCGLCGATIPGGKYRHAVWCSDNCRKAASRARRRGQAA